MCLPLDFPFTHPTSFPLTTKGERQEGDEDCDLSYPSVIITNYLISELSILQGEIGLTSFNLERALNPAIQVPKQMLFLVYN